MNEIAKQLGFENEEEMCRMIASVDLSNPEELNKFKEWQDEDGTKEGLNNIIGA